MKKIELWKAIHRVSLLPLGLLVLAACGGEGGQSQDSPATAVSPGAQPMSETVQNLVSQGNEAQRQALYQEALGYYREAMAEAPGHPVPEFGALMAAMALGDSALADSLSGRLAVTAPELVGMLNPDGSMGGMVADPHQSMPGMPPGHPSVTGVGGDTLRPDTSGLR